MGEYRLCFSKSRLHFGRSGRSAGDDHAAFCREAKSGGRDFEPIFPKLRLRLGRPSRPRGGHRAAIVRERNSGGQRGIRPPARQGRASLTIEGEPDRNLAGWRLIIRPGNGGQRGIRTPARQGRASLTIEGEPDRNLAGWRLIIRPGNGGQRGIRTLETVARLHAFQACAFDHSATCPFKAANYSGAGPTCKAARPSKFGGFAGF